MLTNILRPSCYSIPTFRYIDLCCNYSCWCRCSSTGSKWCWDSDNKNCHSRPRHNCSTSASTWSCKAPTLRSSSIYSSSNPALCHKKSTIWHLENLQNKFKLYLLLTHFIQMHTCVHPLFFSNFCTSAAMFAIDLF